MPSTTTARWALAGLSLATVLSSLGTSIANVALPTLAKAFDATFQEAQWIVVAYLVSITGSIVGAGRLGDVVGRRRLLRAGLVVFTAASVVSGVASALWLLIAARAVQGLGAAAMTALALAFASELGAKDRTGRAMGLLGTMSAIGTALGPALGGVLIAWLGWPSIFLINVPLGLVAIFLVQYVPADPVSSNAQRSLPLMAVTMLRDPVLSASLAANLLVSAVLMATLVVGPFYLSLALGLPAGRVGVVMSIGPIVAALAGVPAGRLVDRFDAHRTALAGLAGIAVGSLVLAATPETLGVAGYVAPIVLITGSYALFQAANNTAALRDVRSSQRGVVSGTLSLSRNLGLIAGASVMGAVFARASGMRDVTAAPAEPIATGMRMTFALATALIMVALVVVAAGRALAARRRLLLEADELHVG